MFEGIRTITSEEICPPGRVRVLFRVSVKIRAQGQFSSGVINCPRTMFDILTYI